MCKRLARAYRHTCQLCRTGSGGSHEGELPTELCKLVTELYPGYFRRYLLKYEGVIPTLCANLEELDEPEVKASLMWIIGEYANKIDNADELLGIFVDSFTKESYAVRVLSILPSLDANTVFYRSNYKL